MLMLAEFDYDGDDDDDDEHLQSLHRHLASVIVAGGAVSNIATVIAAVAVRPSPVDTLYISISRSKETGARR